MSGSVPRKVVRASCRSPIAGTYVDPRLLNREDRRRLQRENRRRGRTSHSPDICPRCQVLLRHGDDIGEYEDDRRPWHWDCIVADCDGELVELSSGGES